MSTNNSLGEFPPMSPPPHYADEEEDEITPVPLNLDGDASLTPLPQELSDLWCSDKILKYLNEEGKKMCRCLHCNANPWSGWNHTKLLRHVCRIRGGDVKPCQGQIPPAYMKCYVAIWNKKKSAKSQKRIREELINISIDQTEEQACLNYDEHKRQKNKLGPQGPALNDMLDVEELIEDPDEDTIGTTTITTRTKSESAKTSYLSGSKSTLQTHLVFPKAKNSPAQERSLSVAIAHYIIANSLPFNHSEDILFKRVLVHSCQVNNSYRPPLKDEVAGDLLQSVFDAYYVKEVTALLREADIFGISVYGDGATINTVPQINVMAASPNNPGCVLDVIDCTDHMAKGGKKDAEYISNKMLPIMVKIDPHKHLIKGIIFDGAGNVQKAGDMIESHFPCSIVTHGTEHVTNIQFEKWVRITPIKEYAYFCKVVSNLSTLCDII